jgi:hypothetical protein
MVKEPVVVNAAIVELEEEEPEAMVKEPVVVDAAIVELERKPEAMVKEPVVVDAAIVLRRSSRVRTVINRL